MRYASLFFFILGALILIGVLVTWMVTRQQSVILALAGFLLILLGALQGVEAAEAER